MTDLGDLHEVVMARSLPGFYVVDGDLNVLLALPASEMPNDPVVDGAQKLTPSFLRAVRDVTSTWHDLSHEHAGVAIIDDSFVVHVRTARHAHVPSITLIVMQVQGRNPLDRAIASFGFTPREADVLGLILQGRATPEIAEALHIARPTVLQHVKSLLAKTNAHRRSDLVNIVLNA
jgi:DNA-binding CsgD family transcriptional regulator